MRFRVRALLTAAVMIVALALVNPGAADAGPYWTGCRPDIDPETLEISTLCY